MANNNTNNININSRKRRRRRKRRPTRALDRALTYFREKATINMVRIRNLDYDPDHSQKSI